MRLAIHFCEIPTQALCGEHLEISNRDYPNFYDHTSNCFSAVTCAECREAIFESRLGPRGFSRPPEWTARGQGETG